MSLGDLHKKLYQKDDQKDKIEQTRKDYFKPLDGTHFEEGKNEDGLLGKEIGDLRYQKGSAQENSKKKIKKVAKISLIALGAIVLVVLAVMILVKFQDSAFAEENIVMNIDGPDEIKSGQEIEYVVEITNNNRVALKDVVLGLNYPKDIMLEDQDYIIKDGFENARIEIGRIEAKQTLKYNIPAKTFGPREHQVFINASLTYQPENFSSQFRKQIQKSGIIKTSLLELSIITTKEVASGEQMEINLQVKNQSQDSFDDIQLRMEYPQGFSFLQSNAVTDKENKTWQLGTIEPGGQKQITISGSLEGPENSVKNFKALVGKARTDGEFVEYNENEAVTKIVAQRIQILQQIEGNTEYYANAGDTIEYSIKFKNNSGVSLRDLILTESIESPVIDKTQVQAPGGFYDSENNQIVWKASGLPALKLLEPNHEAIAKFKVKVKDRFPMSNSNDTNFIITSQAAIDSLDVDSPLGQNKKIFSNRLDTKVNSKLILDVLGFYNNGEMPNSGPLPLEVKNETTFTLRFNIQNTSNNLKDVILTTSLPPGISWKNNFVPKVSGLDFNDRSNELKWLIGSVDAGVGFINPLLTLDFQVGVTPSENQIGQYVTLLNPVKITALDAFTNQEVEYSFMSVNTETIEDVAGDDARVVPAQQ